MLEFWSVINCFLLHGTKKLTLLTLQRLQSHLPLCLQIIVRQDRFVMHALIHEANMCHISAQVKIKIA